MKNLFLIQPKPLLRAIYPRALWNMDRDEKAIYLTFDDGPIEGLTEWVLEELERFGARATFFCVGDNVQKNGAVFEKIKAGGHALGNHTMFHTKGFRVSAGAYLREVEECRKLVDSPLFRPPYGKMKPSQYRALVKAGYRIVLWDVVSYDYEPIDGQACVRKVLRNATNGSIVLFHDNIKAEKNLKYALPKVLQHFSELGYKFKAL